MSQSSNIINIIINIYKWLIMILGLSILLMASRLPPNPSENRLQLRTLRLPLLLPLPSFHLKMPMGTPSRKDGNLEWGTHHQLEGTVPYFLGGTSKNWDEPLPGASRSSSKVACNMQPSWKHHST